MRRTHPLATRKGRENCWKVIKLSIMPLQGSSSLGGVLQLGKLKRRGHPVGPTLWSYTKRAGDTRAEVSRGETIHLLQAPLPARERCFRAGDHQMSPVPGVVTAHQKSSYEESPDHLAAFITRGGHVCPCWRWKQGTHPEGGSEINRKRTAEGGQERKVRGVKGVVSWRVAVGSTQTLLSPCFTVSHSAIST